MKSKVWILLIVMFTSIQLFAQSSTARFLYLQPSAEITSMGGAGVALTNNSFSAYYNPASFAFSKTFWGSASFERPFASFSNQRHSMISFALPTNNIGTIAITFNSFWVEPQLMTGEGSPEGLGMTSSQPSLFSPTHFQLKASYANKIFNSLAVGVSLSWLNISHSGIPVGQESGLGETSAVLVDLGILMNDLLPNATYIKPSKLKSDLICNEEKSGFAFGLSLLNFGPKIFFIDRNQEDPLPSRILFGLSYWALSTDLISAKLALDFENRIYDSDSFDYIHIGSDFQFYKVFSLRAGYVVNNIDSDLSYFTMGVGAKIKYASFNIARYTKFITPTWNFDIRINYEI